LKAKEQDGLEAASFPPAEFSLDDVRRIGILAIQEFERRLGSGRPISDTALSRQVGQLVQLLEVEEQRRRESEVDLSAVGAVDGDLVSTLEGDFLPAARLLELAREALPMYVGFVSRLEAVIARREGELNGGSL
jgi:hypothetical protein